MLTAESIQFVEGDRGWEMHVTTEDGFVRRYNVHGVAFELFEHMQATIGEWRQEGLSAALSGVLSDEEAEPDYDLARELQRPRWRPSVSDLGVGREDE